MALPGLFVPSATTASVTAEATARAAADTLLTGSGTLAARPAAATYGIGYYLATDTNGGTLYKSDGSAWAQVAPGVSEVYSAPQVARTTTLDDFTTSGNHDVSNLALAVVADGVRSYQISCTLLVSHDTALQNIPVQVYDAGGVIVDATVTVNVAGEVKTVTFFDDVVLTAATHNMKVRVVKPNGTGHLYVGGTATQRGVLKVA